MGKRTQEPRVGKDAAAHHQRKKREDDYETHLICRVCGKALQSITWAHLKKHGLTSERYKKRFNEHYLMSPFMRTLCSKRKRRIRRANFRPRESLDEIRRDLLNYVRRRFPTSRRIAARKLLSEDMSLYNQAIRIFGSWAKAMEACELSPILKVRYYSKADVASALRKCAQSNGSICYKVLEDQDPALPDAVHRHFGSISVAARTLGIPFRSCIAPWSPARIRRQIKERIRRKSDLTSSGVQQDDGALYSAAVRYFGSWKAALESCGLEYARVTRHVDRSLPALARDLARWVKLHGTLSYMALRRSDMALCSAAERRFGSVAQAARAHGLPFEAKTTTWTRSMVRCRIRELYRLSQPLTTHALRRVAPALVYAGWRLYGSWGKALESAGIDPKAVRQRRGPDPKVVEQEARAWVNRHGPLNFTALSRSNPQLCRSIQRTIGSLSAAARKLGLPHASKRTTWDKELVISRIRGLNAKSTPLNAHALRKGNSGLLSAGEKLFGSWDKALLESGLDPSTIRKHALVDAGWIERELRAWVAHHGPLNYTALRKSNCRLCSAVESRIGTIGDAAKKFALPFQSRTTNWSKELILRRIRELHAAGQAINSRSVGAKSAALLAAGHRHFGSWDNALMAAGIDPATVRRQ